MGCRIIKLQYGLCMKKKVLKIIIINIALFAQFTASVLAQAQIDTALGKVPTDASGLAQWFLDVAIKLVGGIGILLLLYGGFTFMTSAGDPHKVQEGSEIIFSAIAGIFVIILSAIILRILGYDILKIF